MVLNVKPALYFINERVSILRKREAGELAPWTDDPILRNYSFCNVERENDRVTKYIAKTWRDPNAKDPDLWFAMTVARLLNWPETLDELGYPVPHNGVRFRELLSARMKRGEITFGPGYVVPNGGSKKPKVDYITDVLDLLWRARARMSPSPGKSLAFFCARLMDFDGIGPFLAGQIIADTKYVEPLRSAPDWLTFVVSGPGSRRGLNRIMGRTVDAPWTEPAWQAAFRQFEAAIRPELERIELGDLHCQDLQNCLCEIDKYLRATSGEGKPKRRFPGGAPSSN